MRTAAAEGGRTSFHAALWSLIPIFAARRAEKAGRRAVDGQGYGLPVSAVCD